MGLDALRNADRKKAHQFLLINEGLSEKHYESFKRGIEYFDRSAFSQVKNWVRWTFGIGSCLFLGFAFVAGIYLSYEYLGGLLAGNPNEDLGELLSTGVISILFSLSALFLQRVISNGLGEPSEPSAW